MDNYANFIFLSRYSRFLPEESRRETWPETVTRLIDFWKKQMKGKDIEDSLWQELYDGVYNHEVMPSMRSLWSAGPALEQNHFRGYNCSFKGVDNPRVFDEILYILMAGTGGGFSPESQFVSKLPIINDTFVKTERVIPIGDSSAGWAKALRKLIADLYLGNEHEWDYSRIRPEGARLKTMGGRASGPKPLMDLFAYLTAVFKHAAGRKLTPQEVHDIVCKIAEIVVVGGVRRSALISLSDLADPEIRDCKSGMWWERTPHRALANNSAIYDQKPSMALFMEEWTALMKSGSGERGIYNRQGARAMAPARRNSELLMGTNPCAEIVLRDGELCNLSEVVARQGDTKEDLMRKVKLATILGTLQASLTDFPYVRKLWQRNCEEEALLGVSLTGIQDCELLQNPDPNLLESLKLVAIRQNFEFSNLIGIKPSAAITTIKPSGTVSQKVNSSSGIHGRFSPFYIRSVRQSNIDPLTLMLKDQGVPNEPDAMAPEKTTVFYFPVKSPPNSVMAGEQTALEQLENWLVYQKNWSEHSVSVTIYVKEHEWLAVGDWVYKHFDYITGISFLPYSEHTYTQAPYDPITEEQYNAAVAKQPVIDFSKLSDFEQEDGTTGSQELACQGGACDIL